MSKPGAALTCISPRAWVLSLVCALAACISPTLPPDDPPAPDTVVLGAGTALLSGHVGEGPAFVFAQNRVTDLVFGQRTPTGAYSFEVQTGPCDQLRLWYSAGVFQSTSVLFVPAELAGQPELCRESTADPQGREEDAGDAD
jgi:hypothetical protein